MNSFSDFKHSYFLSQIHSEKALFPVVNTKFISINICSHINSEDNFFTIVNTRFISINICFHIQSRDTFFTGINTKCITINNGSIRTYLHGRDVWCKRGPYLPRQRLWQLLWFG
jgi:hypothetical protein